MANECEANACVTCSNRAISWRAVRFNLYYGALKGTPYQWLNLARLCQLLFPKNDLHQIKYFTAIVSARPHDPDQAAGHAALHSFATRAKR